MKFILGINNKTSQKFPRQKILNIFKHTIKSSGLTCLEKKDLELSVAFVDEDEIEQLNATYRKKKKPTDVLSFSEYENTQCLCSENANEILVGDLILCPSVIAKNALEDGEELEYAMTYIIAHGILHLLGFDHGKKMFDLQRAIADELVKNKNNINN